MDRDVKLITESWSVYLSHMLLAPARKLLESYDWTALAASAYASFRRCISLSIQTLALFVKQIGRTLHTEAKVLSLDDFSPCSPYIDLFRQTQSMCASCASSIVLEFGNNQF